MANNKLGLSNSQKLNNKLDEIATQIFQKKKDSEDEGFELSRLHSKFSSCALDLYKRSLEDNYFWQFCPLKVYESHFEKRKQDYLSTFPDATCLNFINTELNTIGNGYQDYKLETYIGEVGYPEEFKIEVFSFIYFFKFDEIFDTSIIISFIESELKNNFTYSQDRKREFLESKINQLKEQPTEVKESKQEPEIFLDYSDNSKVERIVFLHELGILDFLQEKMNNELHYFAPNKLAEIVSTFTDIIQETVQSYLNPMFSDANQKKNILTENNLKKVRNKLKDIGFNKTKTT